MSQELRCTLAPNSSRRCRNVQQGILGPQPLSFLMSRRNLAPLGMAEALWYLRCRSFRHHKSSQQEGQSCVPEPILPDRRSLAMPYSLP